MLMCVMYTCSYLDVLSLSYMYIHVYVTYVNSPRRERPGPSVLILSPTRELALQIKEESKKYSYKDIKWSVLVNLQLASFLIVPTLDK